MSTLSFSKRGPFVILTVMREKVHGMRRVLVGVWCMLNPGGTALTLDCCVGGEQDVLQLGPSGFPGVLLSELSDADPVLRLDVVTRYMVTSGMDKKLKLYDIRAFKPLKSFFLPAGASCLSLSQRGLLSAATGDIVQVYKDVWSTPVTKPYMAHRAQGTVWGLHFCPFEDVLGVGHGDGFTSMLVPGAGEPNFDGLDANPYRSAKQRQEWEVKALLEKIQPELITLDPNELGQVDHATFQQRHQDRIQALGFDPLAKEKFIPKFKKKGRSSAGSVERRKKQVAHEDQRDIIRKTVEDKMKMEKEREEREKKKAVLSSSRSALDRFKK